VHAVRLAAQAVATDLADRGRSTSSSGSGEEDQSEPVGPSGSLSLTVAPRAVARRLGAVAATSSTEGQGNGFLEDARTPELAATQRCTDLLARPEEAVEKPAVASGVAAAPRSDLAPAQTPSSPEEVALSAAGGNGASTLVVVLQAVRQDWTARELQAVQDKLARIQITSAEQLFQALRSKGVKGVNASLKASGQKCLKSETLADLHEYGESVGRSGGVADQQCSRSQNQVLP